MVVNVFLPSTTVVPNHFAEGSQIQTYEFLESRTKIFYHKTIDTFCFIALTESVTHNFRGVTERHCSSKGILGFTCLQKDGEYIPQCVLCMKTMASSCFTTIPTQQRLNNAHKEQASKSRSGWIQEVHFTKQISPSLAHPM